MTKKQTPPQEQEAEQVGAQSKPLSAFVEHQGKAIQELGRAALSLIPNGVRTHGWNALEESAKGFGALAEVVAEGVNNVVKSVKDEVVPAKKDHPEESEVEK